SASRSIELKTKLTASASSICSRETPAASTARISSTSTACSRVSLRSIRNVARNGASMFAVSGSESTSETLALSRYALAATAACAFVQNSHAFTFETKAAISSRSPTDHAEGPRIASWTTFCIGAPKKSERYLTSLRTSGTGWRETARTNANSAFVAKPWALSRIARRMLTPLDRGFEGRDRRIVLPCGLANRGAHHDLEDLVLAEARCPRRGDVLVGDLGGLPGDLADQGARRLGEPRIVERGAAQDARRMAVSLEDPRDQRLARLRDIRH